MNLRSSPGRSNLPVIASGIISSSTMAADAAVSGCLPRSDLSDPIALATSPWSAYSRARSLAHWRCSARSMAPLSSLLFLCPACSPFPRVLDGHEGMCVYRFCQTVMLRSRFVGICPSCHVVPEHAAESELLTLRARQDLPAPRGGKVEAVGLVLVAAPAAAGRLPSPRRPRHAVRGRQVSPVQGEALRFHPEPVQPDPGVGERADDPGYLPGRLPAAHAADPHQGLLRQGNPPGLVQVGAAPVVVQVPAL